MRPENVPEAIRIAGRLWRIEWVERGTLLADRWERKNRVGECDWGEQVIRLSYKLRTRPAELRATLLHEILHACAGAPGDKGRPRWLTLRREEQYLHKIDVRLAGAVRELGL